ncbi:hypothetical protein GR160_10885 [Flavobacterium sp. Sd200]|uniref:hypothetical protein n=1 Tax=Flavobacterium sp. Sd200 TaxID=2692211 RepID=UPI00136D560E|nr:hypothetical protein [Flavobacterium sp. Sd200]MXN91732.1 hypothetical protein [Flavobacterium sp. Sd200]
METLLKEALWAYIIGHNPELMYDLQENYTVGSYLDEKVQGVQGLAIRLLSEQHPKALIEELCLRELTRELKPSRYLYLKCIFEEEFPDEAALYTDSGILVCEVISMLEYCKPILDEMGFSVDNEGESGIRNAIIGHLYGFLYTVSE